MEKVMISQDELYKYLQEHGVKLVRLAELADLSGPTMTSCFKHQLINGDTPRKFTAKAIDSINAALPRFSDMLINCSLTFGSEHIFTNQRGVTYDPALVGPMKKIGELLNITALTSRVLGWSKDRKEGVLVSPSSKVYGCISRDDVDSINAELREVSNWFLSHEVIPNDSSDDKAADVADAATAKKKKGTRARMEQSFESKAQAWDDTTLPLAERCALFHAERPGGVLFFRVNDGYTVAKDDAALVSSWDHTITPYTDHSTGLTTAYMSAEKFDALLPRCVQENHRVGITDMYAG